jgi:acyl carrier protein
LSLKNQRNCSCLAQWSTQSETFSVIEFPPPPNNLKLKPQKLGLKDLKTISQHSTLAELGMDSMMAVEIKQTLEREFEMFLSAQDIRGLTFARLTELAQSMQEQFKSRQDAAKENVRTLSLITRTKIL